MLPSHNTDTTTTATGLLQLHKCCHTTAATLPPRLGCRHDRTAVSTNILPPSCRHRHWHNATNPSFSCHHHHVPMLQPQSEVESKVIMMGHPISCCHAPVVRSFFIHCKMIMSPEVFCYNHLTILVTIVFTQVKMGHLLPKKILVLM